MHLNNNVAENFTFNAFNCNLEQTTIERNNLCIYFENTYDQKKLRSKNSTEKTPQLKGYVVFQVNEAAILHWAALTYRFFQSSTENKIMT